MQHTSCSKCKYFYNRDCRDCWDARCIHPSCYIHEPHPKNYNRAVGVTDYEKKNKLNDCPDYEPSFFTKLSTLIKHLTRR